MIGRLRESSETSHRCHPTRRQHNSVPESRHDAIADETAERHRNGEKHVRCGYADSTRGIRKPTQNGNRQVLFTREDGHLTTNRDMLEFDAMAKRYAPRIGQSGN